MIENICFPVIYSLEDLYLITALLTSDLVIVVVVI